MKINVDNKKYTFVRDGLKIKILRHGQEWHEQEDAFNALSAIMYELDAARVVVDAARRLGGDAPIEIKKALYKHSSLVFDVEQPSEWAS